MAIFLFFKTAAAAILDFRNFKFLTVGRVTSVELRHYAKFRRNRSKRGRDIAIYRFFKMAAAAILDRTGQDRKKVKYNPFVTFFLSCPFFLAHTPSSNRATDFRGLWLK